MHDINQSVHYRYPGAVPFSTEQKNLFFGRDQDIEQLLELVDLESIVVLYGKSGLGKSSLINAGIIPALEKVGDRIPIVIRFGAWNELKEGFVLDSTKSIIRKHYESESFLGKIIEKDNSLWYYLKNWQLEHRAKPLLIFDQFEELFTYPEKEIENFKDELAEALQVKLPLRYHRRLDELEEEVISDEEEDLLEIAVDPHVIFSIRSDKYHLLDRIATHLPSTLRTCYELQALRPKDAKNAIIEPACYQGDFVSPTFQYSEAALHALLRFLQDRDNGRVEGILIQMLCENYEKNIVIEQGVRFLDVHNIGNPSSVIKNYYIGKINLLPEKKRLPARQLIEEGLVSAEGELRLSLHENFITREYDVDEALLKTLVNNHLLRAELFLRGGYNYEVSHDRLVPAILELYEARKNEEEETKRKKEALRVREEAEKVKKDQLSVQRQSRINAILLLLVLSVSAYAIYLGYKVSQRTASAERAETEAAKQREEAEEALAKFHGALLDDFIEIETQLEGFRERFPQATLPPDKLQQMKSIAERHPQSDTLKLKERIKSLSKN